MSNPSKCAKKGIKPRRSSMLLYNRAYPENQKIRDSYHVYLGNSVRLSKAKPMGTTSMTYCRFVNKVEDRCCIFTCLPIYNDDDGKRNLTGG